MYAPVVLGVEVLRDMGKESLIDIVGDEGGEGGKSAAEGVENFKEGVECMRGVFLTVLAL